MERSGGRRILSKKKKVPFRSLRYDGRCRVLAAYAQSVGGRESAPPLNARRCICALRVVQLQYEGGSVMLIVCDNSSSSSKGRTEQN